jgi:hypothetical protein
MSSLSSIGTVAAVLTLGGLSQPGAAQSPKPTASAPAAVVRPSAHPAKQQSPARAPLDLRAPALNRIYMQKELTYILSVDTETDMGQGVTVKSDKYVIPVPLGQLQAIPWAFMHPTQAWRIITPLAAP